MTDPVLAPDRLLLRDFEPGDYEAVHEYATDIEVVRYMSWGPNTEVDTRDFLERAAASAAARPRIGYELAVTAVEDGHLFGGIELSLAAEDSQQAMLGYCFSREAWGQGYATEAAEAMLMLGFDVLGLHRVWAGCDSQNADSAHVLEKIGMVREGRMREDVRVRGEWRDTLLFGILEAEYNARLSE